MPPSELPGYHRIARNPSGQRPYFQSLTPLALTGAPFIPAVLLCILFGWGGLMVTTWGVLAIRNRGKVIHMDDTGMARRFVNAWTALTFGAGLSMLAGAILIWSVWPVALALALWPPALMILMVRSNRVSVISNLSSGSSDDYADSDTRDQDPPTPEA